MITLEEGQAPLALSGICRAKLHSTEFTRAGAAVTPSPDADRDAEQHRLKFDVIPIVSSRHRLIQTSESSFKSELLANRPVILGFRLPHDYVGLLRSKGFRWLDAGVSLQQPETGHAVVVSVTMTSSARFASRILVAPISASAASGGWVIAL